jgi:hypothetical protein
VSWVGGFSASCSHSSIEIAEARDQFVRVIAPLDAAR